MPDRYIKHKLNGHVLIHQAHLFATGDYDEVADATGAPLVELEQAEVKPQKPTKGKKAADPVNEFDLDLDAALSADASRNL